MRYYAKYSLDGSFTTRTFTSEHALDEWLSVVFPSIEAMGARIVSCGINTKER